MNGRVLHAGVAQGRLLVLDDPLSFWGGFDPWTGEIIDQRHPQAGRMTGGTILALPGSRGSAGTPAGIAEAVRNGNGPAGIILIEPDVNIAVGLMVAARLYDIRVPLVALAAPDFARLETGTGATMDAEGRIDLVARP